MDGLCEDCRYNCVDDESGEEYCDLQLDEDEYAKLMSNPDKNRSCKYFSPDIGEYGIVRKQN